MALKTIIRVFPKTAKAVVRIKTHAKTGKPVVGGKVHRPT